MAGPTADLERRRERVTVHIAVVAQNTRGCNDQRCVLVGDIGIIRSHRGIVDARDGDTDRGRIRTTIAIADRVGEAVNQRLTGRKGLRRSRDCGIIRVVTSGVHHHVSTNDAQGVTIHRWTIAGIGITVIAQHTRHRHGQHRILIRRG